MPKVYSALDLFCGAGGMAEGFLRAGFDIPYACDASREASETYIARHNQLGREVKFFLGDVNELTDKQHLNEFIGSQKIDVIFGGPPCQGFSYSGKRCQKDARNRLFLAFLGVVSILQPKYFIMENVEGILSYSFKEFVTDDGRLYKNTAVAEIIKKEAELAGYGVNIRLLNARNYGVPQNRPRVIFLGHRVDFADGKRRDLVSSPQFPVPRSSEVSVEDAISDLGFLKSGQQSHLYNNQFELTTYQTQLRQGLTPNVKGVPVSLATLNNHQASRHNAIVKEKFSLLQPGEDIKALLQRLDSNGKERHFTKKYRCQKLKASSVSPTILTLPDDLVHYDPDNPRILSVRELARIQSFDDSFVFYGPRTTGGKRRRVVTPQYSQVGNAVPPLLAYAIAEEIKKALIRTEQIAKDTEGIARTE